MYGMSRSIVFESPLRLHMRPAAEISKLVDKYDAVVTIRKVGKFASASSVSDILSMDIEQGEPIQMNAVGAEGEKVLDAIRIMLLSYSEAGIPTHTTTSDRTTAAA